MSNQAMPQMFSAEFNSVKLGKGRFRDWPNVTIWSPIPVCDKKNCPIAGICPYEPKTFCTLQRTYLLEVFKTLMETFKNVMDEELMTKVGFHLLPLYSQLIKFKMHEASLIGTTYMTEKGDIKIHPIYKEIRMALRAIEDTWKSLDIPTSVKEARRNLGDINVNDLEKFGDPGAYDEMEELDKPEKKVKKLRKNK